MKLVAGLTSKNEEWIIGKTLGILSRFCDEIVVLDDGSTDKTVEICKSFDKVILNHRKQRENIWDRKEAEGLNELFNLCGSRKPDYILMLDSDEIPTPSILSFLKKISDTDNNDIDGYSIRMINLQKDENHYRIDEWKPGGQVHNPFQGDGWRKTVIIKYDENYEYKYNLKIQKGGTSKFHPAPANLRKVEKIEDFYGIHYGKLSKKYISREKDRFYALIESHDGKGSYQQRLKHHEKCKGGKPIYKECKKEWFWD